MAGTVDDEEKELVDAAYDHCQKLRTEHSDKMKAVVEYLLKHETMSGSQFAACMEGRTIDETATTSLFEKLDEE